MCTKYTCYEYASIKAITLSNITSSTGNNNDGSNKKKKYAIALNIILVYLQTLQARLERALSVVLKRYHMFDILNVL